MAHKKTKKFDVKDLVSAAEKLKFQAELIQIIVDAKLNRSWLKNIQTP